MSADLQMQRIETLIGELERAADPATRERARELVQAVLEVHAAGLSRVLELIGPQLAERLAKDELVGTLLLLHELHPEIDSPAREAQRALEPAFVPVERLGVRP